MSESILSINNLIESKTKCESTGSLHVFGTYYLEIIVTITLGCEFSRYSNHFTAIGKNDLVLFNIQKYYDNE